MAKRLHTKLVALRMPAEMHRELSKLSKRSGFGLSEYIRRQLRKSLDVGKGRGVD